MLKNLLQNNNLELDKKFYEDCEIFIDLLQTWGKIHNLTGSLLIDDINQNILDSIYPIKFIKKPLNFIDIGSGCGFPGIVLAIYFKDIKSYLVEPRIKRVSFLNFVKSTLKLDNLTVIPKRIEYVSNQKFDLITSRAVKKTNFLLDMTKNIKSESSSYLFYKGSIVEEEIKKLNLLNYDIINKNDRNYLYIKG